jgi:hypothetical protein
LAASFELSWFDNDMVRKAPAVAVQIVSMIWQYTT